MRPSIGLAVGTFGDDEWRRRGDEVMKTALRLNTFDAWSHFHGSGLAESRNAAAAGCGDVDCLVFLDADDRLANGYSDAMREAYRNAEGDKPLLVQPSTLGIYPDGTTDDDSFLIEPKDLYRSNYMVIGTMCERDLFEEIGGFRDLPVIEDWDLWVRMVVAGATITSAPSAVYGVGINPDSRNADTLTHGRVYRDIQTEFRPHRGLLKRVGLGRI